jgi:hypothetical protein
MKRRRELDLANRAYLLTVDDRSVTWSNDPKKEILAEGISEIPVFWASLFRAGDRQIDEYEGETRTLEVPNWCVNAEHAITRLKTLCPIVAGLLDKRSCALWEQWVDFLTTQQCGYFKTNAAEVWDLDPDGYEDYWAVLLRAFEEPSAAAIKAAIEQNGLQYLNGAIPWDDDVKTICKLAGADHIRDLPWMN